MTVERFRGRLVKWNGTWGFIKHDGKETFVHLSNCVSGFIPEINLPVEFELTPAAVEGKPPQAFRVRSLRKDSEAGMDALRRSGIDVANLNSKVGAR